MCLLENMHAATAAHFAGKLIAFETGPDRQNFKNDQYLQTIRSKLQEVKEQLSNLSNGIQKVAYDLQI
jgi:hypothetical protein